MYVVCFDILCSRSSSVGVCCVCGVVWCCDVECCGGVVWCVDWDWFVLHWLLMCCCFGVLWFVVVIVHVGVWWLWWLSHD